MEIAVNNLSLQVNGNEVLSKISFNIDKKSIIGLIGTSKTVLLELLCGNNTYNEGMISIEGIVINKDSVNEIRKVISIVHQDYYDKFITDNVKDEMIININKAHYQNSNMKEHMKECMKMVGLNEEYLARSIKSLSLAEKKLVSLAIALVNEPNILLLDEIMVGLDFANKRRIIQLIRTLKEKHDKTIILATNDSNLLYQLADKILVIFDGKIQGFDTPQLIFTKVDMLNRCNIDVPDLILFTYLASQKNIKLSFHKDIRDLIKDVYRHVG